MREIYETITAFAAAIILYCFVLPLLVMVTICFAFLWWLYDVAITVLKRKKQCSGD